MPDSHPEGRTAIQKDEPDAKAAHTPMNDQTFRNGDTRATQLIEALCISAKSMRPLKR
jgi:hypothetical protein